jgi:hypothetical protein
MSQSGAAIRLMAMALSPVAANAAAEKSNPKMIIHPLRGVIESQRVKRSIDTRINHSQMNQLEFADMNLEWVNRGKVFDLDQVVIEIFPLSSQGYHNRTTVRSLKR